jgi:hypothetical protein
MAARNGLASLGGLLNDFRGYRLRPTAAPESRGPGSSSFWVPRNLTLHMVRQARIGDTVLVSS